MTEPEREGAEQADREARSEPADSASLKDRGDTADDTDVLDGIGGRPRLTWDSVTDTGGAPPDVGETTPKSSFQFDLGGALARLGRDEPTDTAAAVDGPTVAATEADVVPAPDQRGTAGPPMSADEVATPARTERPHEQIETTEFPPARGTSPVEPLPTRADQQVASPPLPSRADRAVETDPLPTRGDRTAPAPVPPEPLPSAHPMPDHSVDRAAPDVTPDAPTEYPRRIPGTHLESQMRESSGDVPTINELTPVDPPPPRPAARQSVFDDTVAVPGAPTLPGGPNPTTPGIPSLPASNPAAPPPVAEPVAPSTPDINALRSAQLRANKQARQGKLFGRSLLAFVLIGGVIAAALVFGRSLLFDTSWDAQLTPAVNDVEAARGAEFDHTVPLEVVSATEMGERLRSATIGDGWVDDVPAWRALGLATGSVTAESVGSALASSTVAIYDAEGDRVYLIDGIDAETAAPDLRVALEQAFDAQNGTEPSQATTAEESSSGFVGVSPLASIATRAVDEAIVSGGAVAERRPADETLPLPIAYEIAAVDVLGEPILASAGVTAADMTLGGPYPEAVLGALDDEPGTAASVIIQPGEVSIEPPVALGNDDWALVWGARLPETTVDRLVDLVVADSYRPVDRGGTVCAVAVFQTSTDAAGAEVFASMSAWAAGAPAASQAAASQLSATRIQLESCDPGAEGGVAPNIGVVDSLIDRQQLRLTN